MRSDRMFALALCAVIPASLFACETKRPPPEQVKVPAATTSTASPVPSASAAPASSISDAGVVSTWDGAMPERPIPRGQATVTAMSPPETQLKAIAYMAAMSQPRFDDPWVDSAFVTEVSTKMKPIGMSFDKGSAAEKTQFGDIKVIGGGRRIEILMAEGCTDDLPRRAFSQRAGYSPSTLLSHGVLVIACHDRRAQCLQSTRDAAETLCTTAPRHK